MGMAMGMGMAPVLIIHSPVVLGGHLRREVAEIKWCFGPIIPKVPARQSIWTSRVRQGPFTALFERAAELRVCSAVYTDPYKALLKDLAL